MGEATINVKLDCSKEYLETGLKVATLLELHGRQYSVLKIDDLQDGCRVWLKRSW
jgi:hypothetical protein